MASPIDQRYINLLKELREYKLVNYKSTKVPAPPPLINIVAANAIEELLKRLGYDTD